jgi:hypothetical protein
MNGIPFKTYNKMKKTTFLFITLFVSFSCFAQFGGGSGTEVDPYRIYTKEHLEELKDSVLLGNAFTGVGFVLMNDITDSLRVSIGINSTPFNGYFNGKDHNIILAIDGGTNSLFPLLNVDARIDSLSITGYIFQGTGFCNQNYGIINSCTNNLMGGNIYGNKTGICWANYGRIQDCTNNANLFGYEVAGICYSNNPADYSSPLANIINCVNNAIITIDNVIYEGAFGAGICVFGGGLPDDKGTIIENSINKGNFILTGNQYVETVAGIISSIGDAKIINCQNFGNISGKISNLGGIAGNMMTCEILNCSNYGNLSGELLVGGIGSFGAGISMKNCFNSGKIQGVSYYGGIVYGVESEQDTLMFNLNISNVNSSAIMMNDNGTIIDPSVIFNNFYDKQMCLSKGIADADVPNSAEGKLTTQLTGTSPELQEMLGDGWSYAEGRYPIPLGLENDSMALVAATPVYLHFETEEAYNHVDSVSKNFTVGLENNVSWDDANGRVSFSNENVTLIDLGFENITVNLGDYSKKVRINIVDIETSAPIQTIETGITAYPNPAGEFISLNLNGINAERVDVYDITGKLLSTNNLSSEQTLIFTGNLHSGLYFLKVYDGNRNITILKFTKN